MKSYIKSGAVALLLALSAIAPVHAADDVKFAAASSSVTGNTLRLIKELGLFEKQGINADIVAMENNSIASMALISGAVQFFTASGAEGPIAQSRGQDLVAVSAAYAGTPAVVILSSAKASSLAVGADASAEERLKALDGVVIAAPSATSSYTLALKAATEEVGANVRFTYITQQAMPSALDAGSIEGFIASSPFYTFPIMHETGVLWLDLLKGDVSDQYMPRNASMLYTMGPYADANPDIVQRVRAAYVEFAALAASDLPAIRAAIIKVFPDIDLQSLDMSLPGEVAGFVIQPLSDEAIAHEIEFVRLSNPDLEGLDQLVPADLYVK